MYSFCIEELPWSHHCFCTEICVEINDSCLRVQFSWPFSFNYSFVIFFYHLLLRFFLNIFLSTYTLIVSLSAKLFSSAQSSAQLQFISMFGMSDEYTFHLFVLISFHHRSSFFFSSKIHHLLNVYGKRSSILHTVSFSMPHVAFLTSCIPEKIHRLQKS